MAGLLSRFGGVWKDLSLGWPAEECWDSAGRFVVLHLPTGSLACLQGVDRRETNGEWWWLDRRIPKSLLPEEAFDLVKVLHPNMTCLKRTMLPDWSVIGGHDRIPVQWGERGAYMPESEGRWVDVTKDNWLAYLHWDCEYGFEDDRGVGDLAGMDKHGRFLVLFKDGLAVSSSVRVKVGVDGKSVLATEGGK